MTTGQIIFDIIIGMCNLTIATEWARNGFWEIGIQRPPNMKVISTLFIVVITFFVMGIAQKFTSFEASTNKYVAMFVAGVPFLWLLFFRYLVLPLGLFDFNRARIRTNFWAIKNYVPGEKNPEERAESLRNFGLAQKTIKLFKKAIELQLRGNKVRSVERTLTLDKDNWDYTYTIRCPACPSTIKIPDIRDRNLSGYCGLCGSTITARIEDGKIYTNTLLSKPIRVVNNRNRYNVGVAYEEMGWLYRMMDLFNEAIEALKKTKEISEELLQEEPKNVEYLRLKSLAIFRKAEINHIQGKLEEAKTGYEESLAIDTKLQDNKGAEITRQLLKKVEQAS